MRTLRLQGHTWFTESPRLFLNMLPSTNVPQATLFRRWKWRIIDFAPKQSRSESSLTIPSIWSQRNKRRYLTISLHSNAASIASASDGALISGNPIVMHKLIILDSKLPPKRRVESVPPFLSLFGGPSKTKTGKIPPWTRAQSALKVRTRWLWIRAMKTAENTPHH